MEDPGIVAGCKVWVVAPSLAAASAAVEIVWELAWATMILSLVELVVGHFQVDRRDHRDRDLDIGAAFPVAGVHFAEAMVVIVGVS